MADLFAYGSLMCDDIMASVAGAGLSSSKATLKGYRRLQVKKQHYPGIVVDHQSIVGGVVYHDITAAGWRRLDSFEGDMYVRRRVEVLLENGCAVEVETYVVKEEFYDRLSVEEWSYSDFLQKGKRFFVNGYSGYGEME